MSTRRSALSVAVLDKDVYVMGGYDGNTSLSSVEMSVKNIGCTINYIIASILPIAIMFQVTSGGHVLV